MLVECWDGRVLNLYRFDRLEVGVTENGWAVMAVRRTVRGDGSLYVESHTISVHPAEEDAQRARQALAELLALNGLCVLWRDLVDRCDDLAEKEARKEAERVG